MRTLQQHHIPPDDLARIKPNLPASDPVLKPVPLPGDSTKPSIIPVADIALGEMEKAFVAESIDKGWISSAGRYVREFEAAFAEAVGCRGGVACSSGTTALHLTLAASGIGPGDEVIIPTFTMIATINAVAYTGATPVLVDAEPDTGNIDPEAVIEKVTPKTKALIIVHVYGHPAEMDALVRTAKAHNLIVIEDAAEAHGATYRDRPCGSLGDAAAFSFYANKIITTGEGGMVTSNNAEWLETARCLRDHAFSSDRHFWHRHIGFNYRLSNLQAAVGLGQTRRLDELVDIRRTHAQRYSGQLNGLSGLYLPVERPHVKNVFWMYGIRVEHPFPLSRDELRHHLAAHGIETRTFFVPLHYQPAWFKTFRDQSYPVSEKLCRTGLYLPSGPGLKAIEIDYICDVIRDIPSR